jgi:hypothetical protein
MIGSVDTWRWLMPALTNLAAPLIQVLYPNPGFGPLPVAMSLTNCSSTIRSPR